MKACISFGSCDDLLGDHAPFLKSLSDNSSVELTVVIERAAVGNVVGERKNCLGPVGAVLAKVRPVTADKSLGITIRFPRYILYQVRNESWSAYNEREVWSGNYLRIFSKSNLLDRVEDDTIACHDGNSYFPGEWRHYGIYTQNHIVDVISHEEPVVTMEKI